MSSNRRAFLKTSTAGMAAVAAAPAFLKAAAANEQLNVALIGCGGRGSGVATRFQTLENVRVTHVCDPDEGRLTGAAKRFGLKSDRAVSDLRKVLDDKSVDAVIVATPDHWHSPAAILACNAGKHVYVEKPCSHNVREGRLLVEAARKNKRVVQHGTQSRSNQLIADGIQMLREGIIGEVLVAKAWNIQFRGNIGRAKPGGTTPKGYDTWVGPAEFVPYQSNRYHYTWHWWRNFGTGDMGNDGVHELDYARWGLGVETHPTTIAGIGGKYFHDDDQQFPDTQTVAFEYPGDGRVGSRRQLIFEMRLWSTNHPYGVDNGCEFYGTKGRMMLTKRGRLEVYAGREKRVDNPRSKQPPALKIAHHQADFVDCIRTGRKPNAEIEIGHLSSSLCHLGNLAVRLGRSLKFDPEKEQIVGDNLANAMLTRPYRKAGHWAVPTGV